MVGEANAAMYAVFPSNTRKPIQNSLPLLIPEHPADQRPQQSQSRPCVVLLPVPPVDGVVREGIAILPHPVERQRLYGLRIGGVGVSIFGPAVHKQQKI